MVGLVERMLDPSAGSGRALHKQLPKAGIPHEQESLKRTIAATRELIARMEKIQSTLACGQPVRMLMVTNGALMTHETARFLVDNQASVSVSIDGDQLAHDERRKDQNGFGSFQLAVRGYSMLKQAGGSPGISCTLGNHNVSRLPEISAYFAKELKPEVE
jgi:sulfatase maturation enzyme AslB (radical SAM superfamily)